MSPTARGACRIIAILRYVDPCPGLPHCAQRPLAATGAAPSNRPCERCVPALRAFAPPREPVRCTRRRGARGEDVARGVCFRWRVQPCPTRPILERTAIHAQSPYVLATTILRRTAFDPIACHPPRPNDLPKRYCGRSSCGGRRCVNDGMHRAGAGGEEVDQGRSLSYN